MSVSRIRPSGCIKDLCLVEHALSEGSIEESRHVAIGVSVITVAEVVELEEKGRIDPPLLARVLAHSASMVLGRPNTYGFTGCRRVS